MGAPGIGVERTRAEFPRTLYLVLPGRESKSLGTALGSFDNHSNETENALCDSSRYRQTTAVRIERSNDPNDEPHQ